MQKVTENQYTFIAEYKHGTYISQCMAPDVLEAIRIWIFKKTSDFLSDNEQNKLKNIYDNEIYLPIKVSGVDDVWCCSYTINRHLIILNIIKMG